MENGDWYSMESVDMRRIQPPYRHDRMPPYEPRNAPRRSLSAYNLPTDYHTDNDHKEYDVKFAGIIHNIQVDVDITNRTEVLRMIDQGKMEKKIPLLVSVEHDAILSLSRHNIKLSSRDHTEQLLVRVPIHEIAAVCYVNDDGTHILSVKYGNTENCSLLVLYCDSKETAERVCAHVAHCFQLVYTDAVVQLLEDTIVREDKPSTGSPTINNMNDVSTPKDQLIRFWERSDQRSRFSQSQPNLSDSSSKARDKRSQSVAHSETSAQSAQAELLKNYLEELKSKFTVDELAEFSTLLRAINDPTPKDFRGYFNDVYKLYGEDRKHLLAGLCPFILEKNYTLFTDFLKKQGIAVPENGTLSSRRSFPRIYTRSVSDVSTTNDQSDIDSVLEGISTQLAQIDHNIGDVPSQYLYH